MNLNKLITDTPGINNVIHYYNTEEEIETFANTLKSLLK